MPESASTRLALVGPSATDPIASGDDVIRAIITRLEAAGAGFIQGTTRPSASAALQGYVHFNTGNANFSYCTGSGWTYINADLALARLQGPGAGKVVGHDVATGVAGAVTPPGAVFDYKAITSTVTVSGSSIGAATTILTMNATTFDGAAVWLEFYSPQVSPGVGASYIEIHLMEGSTDLGMIARVEGTTGTSVHAKVRVGGLLTPSAGVHTYKIAGVRSGGDWDIRAGAGGAGLLMPTFACFTKV